MDMSVDTVEAARAFVLARRGRMAPLVVSAIITLGFLLAFVW